MVDIKFIAALDSKNGIAKSNPNGPGKIPWNLPTDQKYFRDMIQEGPVVMGWNTYAANGFKPYGVGINTVITRSAKQAGNVAVPRDAKSYFDSLKEDVWVLGGGQIYSEFLPRATHLYITRVEGDFGCDIFFPEFENLFQQVESQPVQIENGIKFQFQIWEPKKPRIS